MRTLAAIALVAVLVGCSGGRNSNENSQNAAAPGSSPTMQSMQSTHEVVLHPSTRGFKEIDAACTGSLGGVTFAMNHLRSHAMAGVDINEAPASGGVSVITFTDKARKKSATVQANAETHTVTGNGLTVKVNGSIACVK